MSQVFPSEASSSAVQAKCLNIHLYNLAAISSETLDQAIQDAAQVLATAGIDAVCWNVMAEAPEAHTLHTSPPPTWRKNRQAESRGYLVVVIAPRVPADYLPGALGYALPDAEIGVSAMVFYDRIERFKGSGEIDLPTLLGHAMAHEIGHVLLGTIEHSPAGIMKARWSQADFQAAGLRFMTFTALQREEILALSAALPSIPDASEHGSRITVFVYNYADIPPEELAETEAEAARIYQPTGIGIQWLDCPLMPRDAGRFPSCQVPPGPTKLELRILSQSMAKRIRRAEDSFGFALYPEDGGFAAVANVFAHDAEQLADRRGMRLGVILGHLAAHELGHLLLGSGSHSSVGIMHVPWRVPELEIMAQGRMVFTPAEDKKMRMNVQVRIQSANATDAALVPGK